MRKLGVSAIGTEGIDLHLRAIEQVEGLEFKGDRDIVAHAGDSSDQMAVLQDSEISIAAICCSSAEREYWLRKALEEGKHVITRPPIAKSYKAIREIVQRFKERKKRLVVVLGGGLGLLRPTIQKLADEKTLGPLLAVDIKYYIDRKLIKLQKGGILELYGYACLNLLIDQENPIDAIFARTRSLGQNCPEENMVWAHLQFKNGLEASIHINALGDSDKFDVVVNGMNGAVSFSGLHSKTENISLAIQYANLTRYIMGGFPDEENSYLINRMVLGWINQAARLEKTVIRKEVQID